MRRLEHRRTGANYSVGIARIHWRTSAGNQPAFQAHSSCSLKDNLAGWRLNAASPDDSLMLLNATAGVPHEGGQRTRIGEPFYEILRSWIAGGAKLNLAPHQTDVA
jgi:hypothetical protein